MHHLKPEKLHVRFMEDVSTTHPITPRRYTLTHSDRTGELFLTIGKQYDKRQISGIYTKLMRDEALAEWKAEKGYFTLHVYVHVSGGLVLGSAKWRNQILHKEMLLVLETIRYGDKEFFKEHGSLDHAPILVHFQSSQKEYDAVENWGTPMKYKQNE